MNDELRRTGKKLNGLNVFLEENGMFSKVNFISLKRTFLFLNLLSFYL